MDFTVLYSVLERYGWLGIFTIVIVSVLFLIIKNQTSKTNTTLSTGFEMIADRMSNQNDKLLTTIQTSNQQMLDYIMHGTTNHDESIETRLSIEDKINDKLHDMLNEYHANRVIIIEFHNSKENLDGLSFVWYDIHYEKFSKGTQDIMMQVQNQPSSVLVPVVTELRNGNYVFWSADDLEEMFDSSCVLYNQLKKIPNLKYILFEGIYNNDNRLIALCAVEWHKDIEVTQITDNINYIKNNVAYISSLLNLSK